MAPEPQEASTDKLPSQKIYNLLDGEEQCQGKNQHGCCMHMKNDLYGALNILQYSSKYASLIAENWCCSHIMRINHVPKEEDRCNFLYYWIGSKINEKLDSDPFDTAIETVCKKLEQFHCNSECKNLYPDISWDMFEKKKIVFDYCYDHTEIEKQLRIPNNSYKDAYCKHVKSANEAFAAVQRDCDGVGSKSKYCREFKKDCEYNTPQMLINSHCGAAYGARTSLGTTEAEGTLQKANLGMLESRTKYYDRFKGGLTYCNYPCFLRREKWDKLKKYFHDERYANVFARALCYVHSTEQDDPTNGVRCTFINYWLFDISSDKLNGDTSFSTLVEAINKELSGIDHKYKCELTDIDTYNIPFHRRKVLLDYSVDHEKINSDLTRFGSPKPSCTKKYKQHLDDINQAYNTAYPLCQNGSTTNCDDFKEVFNKNKNNSTLNLECQLLSEEEESALSEDKKEEEEFPSSAFSELSQDPIEGCTEELNRASNTYGAEIKSEARAEATSTSTANAALPTAVSSGLAVVGLPTILYLLYKYDLLPSWIGKHFGGRTRRGKKIRSINHDLNMFLDDTLTTEYSTEGASTIGSADESTVFGGRSSPTSRERSNNRRGRNISYQRI